MKIPEKIILLGEEFKIKQVSKKDLECDKCGEDAIGMCMFEKKTIAIAIDDEEINPIETLFHELGHYFGQYVDGEKSEAFANTFAKYIQMIIEQLEYK